MVRVGDARDKYAVGCTGININGTDCLQGQFLFGMAYLESDTSRPDGLLRTFDLPGQIQGGICEEEPDPETGLNIYGGSCVCDSVNNGRFAHPSSRSRARGSYDYTFQGWAGAACDIPCAPCSETGKCDAATGACVCYPGWAGFRCMTPCEPCGEGTCAYDGTCVWSGSRRRRDGSFALRLTRDPLYPEKGMHKYRDETGTVCEEYQHPAHNYQSAIEHYVNEVEYECAHREECRLRLPDTHLPIRPADEYFWYTVPDTVVVEAVAELDTSSTSVVSLAAELSSMRALAFQWLSY